METKQTGHTPGPWANTYDFSSHRTKPTMLIEGPQKGDIARVLRDDGTHYGAICQHEMEANARLIAASPELLRALIECVTEPGAACFQDGNRDMLVRRLRAINEIARSAIKKATT